MLALIQAAKQQDRRQVSTVFVGGNLLANTKCSAVTKGVHNRPHRWRHRATARKIEEIAGDRDRPILQHLDEFARSQTIGDIIMTQVA